MDNRALLTHYLSNLNMSIIMANFNLCQLDWQDIDYIPSYNKFYFICEGEGWIKIGDQEYYPKPGQLVFMPEGVQQSYSCINDNPYRKYWCHFSLMVGDIPLLDIIEFPHLFTLNDTEFAAIAKIFHELIIHTKSDAIHAELLAKSKLMELFCQFMMHMDLDQIVFKNLPSTEKMTEVLAYIQANLEKKLTIDELAKVAFMHPNYFIRLFKRQMGMPPIHYITQKKINRARELLINTQSSISEIAQLVGYSNLFHFSKHFKKNVGLTPTEFRKRSLWP